MSCERCDQIHAGPCAEDVVDDQQAEDAARGLSRQQSAVIWGLWSVVSPDPRCRHDARWVMLDLQTRRYLCAPCALEYERYALPGPTKG